MKRRYLPGLRTLEDLRARCTIDPVTGCWAWTGRHWQGGHPALPLAGGNGSVSLQIALAVILTGQRLPEGRAYLPTCGNVRCLNPAHRREGPRGELHQLVAANRKPQMLTDEGRARISRAVREAWDRRREGLPPKPKPEPKPPKVKAVKPPKPAKPAAGPKLHDKLHPLGRPGQMPQDFALRKPGSNARPIPVQQPAPTEARITDKTRVTVCESRQDFRYTVQQLPPGYVSALDPGQARPWAQAAAQGRAV